MVGGGAAALAGLVFIAMSINLPIITRDATHKNRAIATMTGFTAVFMICALALLGNQNYQWIGVEWLVVSLVPTVTYIGSDGNLHTGIHPGKNSRHKFRGAQHQSLHRGHSLLRSSNHRFCLTYIRTCCRTLCGLRGYGALLRFFHFRRMAPHHWHSREQSLNWGTFPSVPGFAFSASADFSVTVSSNEAQHFLIQKSLTQQVSIGVSPPG
jgi:hypothetical protein